jgi:hypothetical protein
MRLRLTLLLVLWSTFLCVRPAHAYSVLTHEQLIDLTWDSSIVPLLKSRYPDLTPAQLEQARAYAYGGCVIQDIGYYPFGDQLFSDLTHYVRTGDFVVALFRNATNANELAFAIGALSHYIGDSVGHATATNRAVPIEFPRLRNEYGSSVNYAEGEHEHVQTEFAFDINEIAQHRLAPVHYLRHIGLQVPTRQLALAYYQTYGLTNDFSRKGRRINVSGYRFSVRNFIPRIAYAVTLLHRSHEPADDLSDPQMVQFIARVQTIEQENNWQQYRRHAGIGTYTLAGLIFVLPKVGPLKLVAVKGPTPQTEEDYIHSVIRSSAALDRALRRFTPIAAQASRDDASGASTAVQNHVEHETGLAVGRIVETSMPMHSPGEQTARQNAHDPLHPLLNRDLDTGYPVQPAGYSLTDKTYAKLVERLTANPQQPIPPGVKQDVLAYYANLNLPFDTRKHRAAWEQLQKHLATLRAMPTSPEPTPYPTYGDDDTVNDPTQAPE